MKIRFAIAALSMLCAGAMAANEPVHAGSVQVEHPYARATLAGQPTAGGYMTLSNHGAQDELTSVSAPVAARVELHSMRMDGDVMRMRQVESIVLPAGQTVELKPGGFHLMFIGLKSPLKAGTQFPMTLHFQKAGEIQVTVKVQAAQDESSKAAMPMSMHH